MEYNILCKRKSIRKFTSQAIAEDKLSLIKTKCLQVKPLFNNIKVEFSLVKKELTSCPRGEYCLMLYSEEKEGYLYNAGYILEQLDLYINSLGIGVCYYGFGKTKEKSENDLTFTMMLNIGMPDEKLFRNSISEFKRNEISKSWNGEILEGVSVTASLSPSAVNTQPWEINYANNVIKVQQKKTMLTKLTKKLGEYFSLIDLGIYLYCLEVALAKQGYSYIRECQNGIFSYTIKQA